MLKSYPKSINSFLMILLIFILVIIDQYSKYWILNQNLPLSITPFITFVKIWNPGISFGLFQNLNPLFFIILNISIVALLFIWFLLLKSTFAQFSLSLVIAGGIGNIIDRFTYNAILDFIDLSYKNFHWWTFNLADCFISLGIILFLFSKTKKI